MEGKKKQKRVERLRLEEEESEIMDEESIKMKEFEQKFFNKKSVEQAKYISTFRERFLGDFQKYLPPSKGAKSDRQIITNPPPQKKKDTVTIEY